MELEKTGTNVGSLCKIELVDVDDVKVMPDRYQGSVIGLVELNVGKEWKEYYFTEDTPHYTERAIVGADGEGYELKVSWRVPKDSLGTLDKLEALKNKRFLGRLTDTNDVVKLAGSTEHPCRVRHNLLDKGQSIRDSNHYVLELSLVSGEAVPVYSV